MNYWYSTTGMKYGMVWYIYAGNEQTNEFVFFHNIGQLLYCKGMIRDMFLSAIKEKKSDNPFR